MTVLAATLWGDGLMLGELDRTPAHERLLTREQIDAIDDIESLVALQEDVTAAAKQIEVDLEFRSDDGADAYWEQRARRALSAHYVCNGHLTRRIKFLRRGGKPVKQGGDDAKARRREATAQLVAAQTEQKRVKIAVEREKTHRALLDFAARQSLLLHFHKAAQEELDGPIMARLMAKANASLQAALAAEAPNTSKVDP